jgi:hypothetical protein
VTSAASQPIADDLAPATQPRRVRESTDGAGWTGRLVTWWSSVSALDLAVCLVFVAFAFWLTRGFWPDPATRAIADNANDQTLIEWFLGQGVLFWQGHFSLVTDRLNTPDGVNLMSNASHILQGVIMAPVTALFGAPVSFALLVALNLAGTAAAWYLLMVRCLKLRRPAAALGAFFMGFAPGMISQSHSHLHITAQWLVPVIVYCLLRLTRAGSVRSTILTGAGLGVTIAAQVLLGEEVLFLTALTLFLFGVVYALRRPRWARAMAPRFGAGSLIAIGVAGVLLTYPLWVQFRGPQHTPNAPFSPAAFYADVASFPLFSPLSLAGSSGGSQLATSSAEYNTFLGLPIILLAVVLIIWRWRHPVTTALAVAAVLMTWLSFGPTVTVDGHQTDLPSLYHFQDWPIVSGALPTRYALALIPLLGLLFAYSVDAAARSTGVARIAVPVAVVAAMIPTLPVPLGTVGRAPVPDFVTSGAWRQCAPYGGVIVPVPLPTPVQPELMRWPAAADDAFSIPEGFFIGPYGAFGRASVGRYPSSTSQLLAGVAQSGVVPQVDGAARAQAQADLAFWQADCVALAHVPNESALHATLDQLLGPGTVIADTWTWKVTR